ncbi:FecR domain-containing protein [Colwellia sp. UCD-KL20]|uniref:FecR family protein n=1 Tax=Colwellia sp. UCD-KL20 TaxID=1917165 RepID=UPI000970E398|nr:FecR domain-containing protein [Colwellia sp. UCD-KL20]
MKNNISRLSDHTASSDDQILDQALHWLAELDRGLSQQRENDLKDWLAQSNKHKDTFLEMVAMWDNLDVLSQLSTIFPYKKTQTKWYQSANMYRVAASIFLCTLLGIYYVAPYSNNINNANVAATNNENIVTYRTQIGEKSTVRLSDGSLITLNTNSEVTVNYSDTQRNLMLNYGEVHVDVAHNKQRKFLVHAGGKVIEAVGTAFNVQHFNNIDIELMVTEGTVIVSELANSAASDKNILDEFAHLLSKHEEKPIAVTAGEQVNLTVNQKIKESTVHVEQAPTEIASRLSWMEGNLVFKGESLQQAVDEISRYSQWKLELQGDDVKKVKIIGRFQTGDIEPLLSILNKNFNINAKHVANNKIILSLNKTS